MAVLARTAAKNNQSQGAERPRIGLRHIRSLQAFSLETESEQVRVWKGEHAGPSHLNVRNVFLFTWSVGKSAGMFPLSKLQMFTHELTVNSHQNVSIVFSLYINVIFRVIFLPILFIRVRLKRTGSSPVGIVAS